MNGLGLKARLASGCPDQFGRLWQIEIYESPADRADCMIVPFGLAIVTTGAVAKANFMNET